MIAIRRLVQPRDLSVVFQPIVELATGNLFAHEALVRCSLPSCSTPPELFERATEERCVGRLGRMIREIAVPLCSGLPLFLNVHPQELVERWLVQPDDPIFSHDHDVYLEITESVPLTHFDLVVDVLAELRARAGVHLVIDDLGAGYSNLGFIADLEPRVVKLDRGLVQGLDSSPRKQRLVASLVRLCNDLGAKVVAEGVETPSELSSLLDTGAHFAQGYVLSRPGFPLPQPSWPAESRKPAAPATPVSVPPKLGWR